MPGANESGHGAMSVAGTSSHPLDHPIWSALTTRQQALAEGGALARRYPPAITPFAAMADMSPESFAGLGALLSPSEVAVLFTPDPVTPPALFKILLAETGEQMIGMPAVSALPGVEPVTLGAADVPAMMELTGLTKPGPFSARTHELGAFLGIKIDGQLVAMAGERMKPANYTEITAVCVHPSHRGRGYGQILLAEISRQISRRGEIPFLHVFSNNASAIALYRRQGMEIRRRLYVTVLQKLT
jgi:ribosomal protein S18 acetylase RimI-like enzyme